MRLRTALAVAVLFVCAGGDIAQAQTEVPLDNNIPIVSGDWRYEDDRISIGGRIYDGHGYAYHYDSQPIVFDVKGFDGFKARVGVLDGDGEGKFSVELDGQPALKEQARAGEPAKLVQIALRGCRALTLRSNGPIHWVEPRLLRGASPSPADNAKKDTSGGGIMLIDPGPSGMPASFAVDPKDLDTLADGLRKVVDNKPELKERIAQGKIAVATFSLVDIDSPSVAQNVAEDLATALIEKEFRLVERGQLDAVLKELKIQNTGLIDPKSAQEIGKLTGCMLILVGSISDRGGFIAVNARLLETQTGDAVAAKRVEMRKIPINR